MTKNSQPASVPVPTTPESSKRQPASPPTSPSRPAAKKIRQAQPSGIKTNPIPDDDNKENQDPNTTYNRGHLHDFENNEESNPAIILMKDGEYLHHENAANPSSSHEEMHAKEPTSFFQTATGAKAPKQRPSIDSLIESRSNRNCAINPSPKSVVEPHTPAISRIRVEPQTPQKKPRPQHFFDHNEHRTFMKELFVPNEKGLEWDIENENSFGLEDDPDADKSLDELKEGVTVLISAFQLLNQPESSPSAKEYKRQVQAIQANLDLGDNIPTACSFLDGISSVIKSPRKGCPPLDFLHSETIQQIYNVFSEPSLRRKCINAIKLLAALDASTHKACLNKVVGKHNKIYHLILFVSVLLGAQSEPTDSPNPILNYMDFERRLLIAHHFTKNDIGHLYRTYCVMKSAEDYIPISTYKNVILDSATMVQCSGKKHSRGSKNSFFVQAVSCICTYHYGTSFAVDKDTLKTLDLSVPPVDATQATV